MPSYILKLNKAAINAEFTKALGRSPEVKLAANKQFRIMFLSAKRAMLKEFDRHPVTAELDAGPNAKNISGTLDGYGNLFSFIGFEAGSNPTADLRTLLDIATNFRQTVYLNRGWYFRLETPSKESIASVTNMPWEIGNSWALQIEKAGGISGLSNYLYTKWEGGRSKKGVQLPYENQEDLAFVPTPYLTEILANFRDRMNNS
jgi:hypothetical protein